MNEKQEKIKWHEGFYGATEIEFIDNKDDLQFMYNVETSKEPLKMDIMVIKKNPKAVIKNEIGHIFKEYNVFEYKSPDDSLNIDDFYKTLGHACYYKGTASGVDSILANEITVTLVKNEISDKLIQDLKNVGLSLVKKYDGIYYVEGNVMFPTQIIETQSLTFETHIFYKSLNKNLNEERTQELILSAEKLLSRGEKNNLGAYFSVLVMANKELIELSRRKEMDAIIYEWFKDRIGVDVNKLREENEILKEKSKAAEQRVKDLEEQIALLKRLVPSA